MPTFVPRERSRDDPARINTHSILSHRTGRGVVVIEWGEMTGQLDPEDARQFAHVLLRMADCAESDAFVYQHFKQFLDDNQLAVLITEFREDRARLEMAAGVRSKSQGDEIPEDDRR